MIAVVVGGTGLTGKFLIQELLRDDAVTKVVAVARKDLGVQDAKLQVVRIQDLGELSRCAAELKGDAYFCCLGTTIKVAGSQAAFTKVDHTAVIEFAKIAKGSGAKALTVVSAMGANAKSMIFYNRVKGQMEADVAAIGLPSVTIFRPALLAGPRTEHRPGEGVATAVLVPLSRVLGAKIGKHIVTEASTVAKRMVDAAKAAKPGMTVVSAGAI